MSTWNIAKAARACRVCVACLAWPALAMLSASLAEADYGPRTTIGNDYQQTSDTITDTIGVDDTACIDTIHCYVLFQPTPQKRPLIVQHVSCRVHIGDGQPQGYFRSHKGNTFPLRVTALAPVPTSPGLGWWAVNTPVKHLVESGERAFVRFTVSDITTWLAECSISGRLLQP